MPRYDWLLFDADNTLLDFTAAERHSLYSALVEEGVEWLDDHHALYHRINHECWTAFEAGQLPKEQLRTIRFERFFYEIRCTADPAAFADRYLAYLAASGHLLQGASELLDELSAHYRLGLVTNGLKEVQRPRLACSGLAAYFEVVVVSDEIGPAKPDPAFFDHAFAEMGNPAPERVLVIGDNLNADIRGSLEYGAHACWFNPEGRAPYLPVEPTFTIKSLRELPAILMK